MTNNPSKVHEPLFHIIKRTAMPKWQSWIVRIVSVLAALIVCGVVTVLLTGEDPIQVYVKMVEGAIGTERRIWTLAQNTAMLLCVALAVTPAFKMKFWNIGAEGQVLAGGLASAACMIFLNDKLSPVLLILVMLVVSVAAGAIWGLIPAFFKAHWNTNETLFTLMMNYIAMCIVSYFSYEWSVPKGSGHIGVINDATEAGWLPSIGGKAYLCNILVVAALTAFMYVYLKYSKHGYEISVVGESENTAKYIGINVKKVILRTMLLSGALCGIAGFLLVSGTDHTVNRDTAGGRGFTAIMVSWLAKFDPLYMILTSLLIVFLQRGAGEISTSFGLNDSFSEIITGIIIFFIIGSEFFVNYQLKFREKEANK
ncbi:MAG: ABC transporter permease [Clostridiaceae bacterium]|nr:ABC transporter permease [Clostridiaceae bacterium]MDD7614005.1 ABC transporter permease [Clostridiaceae bacterium]MDY5890366.1 ABC transporter permease [Oscillospiraceae bacterium]